MSVRVGCKLTNPHARIPTQGSTAAAGYDVTVISLVASNKDVDLYDTGVQLEPPTGFYFELIERSSLWKQGYAVANSVGVIDNDYRGNIMVALRKVRPDASPIQLPARVAQLVLRKMYPVTFEHVQEVSETERGEGGFGSTWKKYQS